MPSATCLTPRARPWNCAISPNYRSAEVASRLGLTINALDVRLHRARKHLRHTLNGELRAEAEAYGLALDDQDMTTGWRETRLWCMICGRQRLHGRFESPPDGRVNLIMRCPTCSPRIGSTENGCLTESGPLDALRGLRSFRPAFRRQVESGFACLSSSLHSQSVPLVWRAGPRRPHPPR